MTRRTAALLLILVALSLVLVVLNLGMGEYPIPVADVVATVLGSGPKQFDYIVNTLRLPRALVGLLAGGGLAVSGAILQGLTRNPLAAPEVVGITGGASLAAVSVVVYFPDAPLQVLPAGAAAGALTAALLTYLLAWRQGSSPLRMILVGIGMAAVAQGLVTAIITSANVLYANQAMTWMTGSVYGRSWEYLWLLAPWLIVLVPLAFGLARHLDILDLGDEVARGLGSLVERHRALLLLVSVALAGACVAAVGTIGFVGLMAPHMARRLTGPVHGGLLPIAALLGGLIVLAADTLGRTAFAPIEVPAGVITAAVGAPYFIYLLVRRTPDSA